MTTLPSVKSKKGVHPAIIWGGLTVGLSVILFALLMLFILPSLHSGPHDLPLGVVGAQEAITQTESALEALAADAYELHEYSNAAELNKAIEDRSIVGGMNFDHNTIQVLVASAGSTAISGTVSATGQAIAAAMDQEVVVVDVVPLPDSDPLGVGIGGLAFPLVFGGIVPAVAFRSILPSRRGWIIAGLIGFSLVGGIVVAAVLKYCFGSFDGGVLPVGGAVALGIAALALPLAGLQEIFGGKGFTIAAMCMMFVGNPFAGIATGAQWLPTGVALIGQLLPPGAAGTLVRAVAYFDGAGGASAALTLSAWILAGLALWFAGPRVKRSKDNIQTQPASV